MRTIAVLFLGLSAACGGKRVASAACDPVPAEFQVSGPVYRDCAVDRKAQPPTTLPSLRSVDLPRREGACLKVVIDMVVDSTGNPLVHTAKVVESNDPRFEELVRSSLGEMRYRPAVKDNEKVAQLVRLERGVQFFRVAVSGSAPSLPSTPPRTNAPNC